MRDADVQAEVLRCRLRKLQSALEVMIEREQLSQAAASAGSGQLRIFKGGLVKGSGQTCMNTEFTQADEAKMINLYNEMKDMHAQIEALGTRKVRLAHKAFDFQSIYTGLVEKKIRFMERDGIGTDEIKLRDDNIDPLAVEDHLFAHP